jgi:hypothetical protein
MASFPVNGSAGIDDCSAGEGACEANGCAGTCNDNDYQMAWPYYGDCIANEDCSEITSVPYAGDHQCNEIPIAPWQRSCADIQIYPTIKDCGPADDQYSSDGYCVSQNQQIIACMNTAGFAALCGGCNPATYGLIGLEFDAA